MEELKLLRTKNTGKIIRDFCKILNITISDEEIFINMNKLEKKYEYEIEYENNLKNQIEINFNK
jgi:hypothetical protein